jgi:hypothetical protein
MSYPDEKWEDVEANGGRCEKSRLYLCRLMRDIWGFKKGLQIEECHEHPSAQNSLCSVDHASFLSGEQGI